MVFIVKPLPRETHQAAKYNKSLPQPQGGSWRVGICGASNGGKTTLAIRMIQEMRGHFSKIVLFTPNSTQWEKNIKFGKHDVIIQGFDEAKMKHHFMKQVNRNRAGKKKLNVAFCFDDCLDALQRSDFFDELMVISRKEHVCILYLMHRFCTASAMTRMNTTHYILLSTNSLELNLLARYLSIDAKTLIKKYNESKAPARFNFLYIHTNPCMVFENFSDKQLM